MARGITEAAREVLLGRLALVERILEHAPAETGGELAAQRELAAARTVSQRARARLGQSPDLTVVALTGGSGSGKSSLFNAISGLALSDVAVRRPTTTATHACVWGRGGGTETLLDWLGVAPEYRFARESALDANDLAALRGLVLLDLPDCDSVVESHRSEVRRILTLADMIIWVTDPQKYAESVLTEDDLRELRPAPDCMAVVLNQLDRLEVPERSRCLDDLHRVLEADGLAHVAVIGTSAVTPAGTATLRTIIEYAVAGHHLAIRRLTHDLDSVLARLEFLAGDPVNVTGIREELIARLLQATGAKSAAQTAAEDYRRQAYRYLRALPLLPLRQRAASSTAPTGVQPTEVTLAVRAYRTAIASQLPQPWQTALTEALERHQTAVVPALDGVIATLRTDHRTAIPRWWLQARAAQWFLAALTTCALATAALRLLGGALGTHVLPAGIPLAPVLAVAAAGLIAGLALRLAVVPAVSAAASRAVDVSFADLSRSVASIADAHLDGVTTDVLERYEHTRAALREAQERAVG